MVLLAWMYSCVYLLISLLTLTLPAGVVKKKKTYFWINNLLAIFSAICLL